MRLLCTRSFGLDAVTDPDEIGGLLGTVEGVFDDLTRSWSTPIRFFLENGCPAKVGTCAIRTAVRNPASHTGGASRCAFSVWRPVLRTGTNGLWDRTVGPVHNAAHVKRTAEMDSGRRKT